jgi:hypothetical protein
VGISEKIKEKSPMNSRTNIKTGSSKDIPEKVVPQKKIPTKTGEAQTSMRLI